MHDPIDRALQSLRSDARATRMGRKPKVALTISIGTPEDEASMAEEDVDLLGGEPEAPEHDPLLDDEEEDEDEFLF
jgi:hypothetical protein